MARLPDGVRNRSNALFRRPNREEKKTKGKEAFRTYKVPESFHRHHPARDGKKNFVVSRTNTVRRGMKKEHDPQIRKKKIHLPPGPNLVPGD